MYGYSGAGSMFVSETGDARTSRRGRGCATNETSLYKRIAASARAQAPPTSAEPRLPATCL